MREIKFRAWYAPECLMLDWDFLQTELNHYDKPFQSTDDYKVMQYTGLHDRNGKEIYEGDIIRYFGKTDAMHFGACVSEVRWNNQYRCGFYPMTSWYSQEGRDILEVIGNIYENPELLQSTTKEGE